MSVSSVPSRQPTLNAQLIGMFSFMQIHLAHSVISVYVSGPISGSPMAVNRPLRSV